MIACTNIQNFEERENAASTISVDHNFGYDMNPFRSDLISNMILFGSNFEIQELSVMLVVSLTNFAVKKQVPQFLFKTAGGDLVLVSSYEVADILFFES